MFRSLVWILFNKYNLICDITTVVQSSLRFKTEKLFWHAVEMTTYVIYINYLY